VWWLVSGKCGVRGGRRGCTASTLLTLHKTWASPTHHRPFSPSPKSRKVLSARSITPCWCTSNSVVYTSIRVSSAITQPLPTSSSCVSNTPIFASCSADVPPKMGPNAAKRSAKCVNACNHCRVKKIKCNDDLASLCVRCAQDEAQCGMNYY